MNHFASPGFWQCYNTLPGDIQELADKNFQLLRADPSHPSLHFKKVGRYRSARIGLQYRAWPSKLTMVYFGSGLGTIQNTIGCSIANRSAPSEFQVKPKARSYATD